MLKPFGGFASPVARRGKAAKSPCLCASVVSFFFCADPCISLDAQPRLRLGAPTLDAAAKHGKFIPAGCDWVWFWFKTRNALPVPNALLSSHKKMKILILEDNEERIAAFQVACAVLSTETKIWRNAHRMVKEVGQHLASADVISLDHDLNDDGGEDAGCGMDIARALVRFKPTCPIVLHTSNTSAGWSMHNELTAAGWEVSRVPPITMGTTWITKEWLPTVEIILKARTKANIKRLECEQSAGASGLPPAQP